MRLRFMLVPVFLLMLVMVSLVFSQEITPLPSNLEPMTAENVETLNASLESL